jgi:hypothetical protein
MRGVQTIDFDPANTNALAIVTEGRIDAEGPLTLVAGFSRGVDCAGQVDVVTTGGVDPDCSIIITGLDADGNPQNETLTNIEADESDRVTTKYYSSITSVEVSGTVSSEEAVIDVGTNGVAVSKAIMLDKYAVNAPLIVQELTGTMAWSIQVATEILDNSKNQGDVVWTDDADHSAISASQQQNLADWPVAYARVITTAITDTAELALRVSQGY